MTEPIVTSTVIDEKMTILPADALAGHDHIFTEYIALSDLMEWPTNPKLHAIEEINASMNRFGYTQPMMIDERSGRLVAGHGRRENLMKLREENPESPPLRIINHGGDWYVPVVRGVSFPSDDAAAAYLLADNRLTEKGGWSQENLAGLIQGLLERGGGEALSGTGFNEADLGDILSEVAAEEKKKDDGTLLSMIDITVDPPKHQVEKGQIWFLGEHHVLACMDVMEDWTFYAQYLRKGGLLVPYPGPFAAFSSKLEARPAVLIQPDMYIAGHILDRYEEVYGIEALSLLQAKEEVTQDAG